MIDYQLDSEIETCGADAGDKQGHNVLAGLPVSVVGIAKAGNLH
ncbi:hypothetical protein ACL9RI_10645 [Janthinobacterium sp. Mn2066]